MTEKPTTLNIIGYEIAVSSEANHCSNSTLQAELAFPDLISAFNNISKNINSMIPHSAFIYSHPEFGLEVKGGMFTPHSTHHTLKFNEKKLGELTLIRSNEFDDAEKNLLETLFCCFIYPLKNTLLYQQSLDMALIDPLTHVNNRDAFDENIKQEVELAIHNTQKLSIIFLNISHFKAINEQYGRDCGNVILTAVAKWIKEGVRNNDSVFRFGDEIFVVLLCDRDTPDALLMSERINQLIEGNTLTYKAETIIITACLGVSSLRQDDTVDTFLSRAVNAMDEAKINCNNRIGLKL